MEHPAGLSSATASGAVALQLRRQMLKGHYPPGTVLRDTELAAKFDVARPTARAAVQALVAAGLLERPRGRSARVPTVRRADVEDLFATRLVLELHAVERITSEHRPLSEVGRALASLEALHHSSEWDSIADADIAFHEAVIAAAGSRRLEQLFDSLATELRLTVALLRPAYPEIGELVAEHKQLYDALEQRDPDSARQLWREHLASAVAEITTAHEPSTIAAVDG